MNKKLIIGNWKMNPASMEEALDIANKIRLMAQDLKQTDTVIAPPFVYIASTRTKDSTKNFFIGAQSVSRDVEGAHTGEISAKMLKNIGVEYVVVGHSEERGRGETDEIVSEKIARLLEVDLIPVVCIGEKSRDQETGAHYDFLKEQIKKTFANVPKKSAKNIVIAYEPIWAIGAKEPMAPDQILETTIFIRKIFADLFDPKVAKGVSVLYGGSVNFKNAGEIMSVGKVDGLLVGRESVNITGFLELLKVVDSLED
jgi:triosephosphate isomerase